MLAEITITPVRSTTQTPHITEALRTLSDLDVAYEVTAMGTLVEGDEDDVWTAARRCHEAARTSAGRVVTTVRIDDDPESQRRTLREQARRVTEEVEDRPINDLVIP